MRTSWLGVLVLATGIAALTASPAAAFHGAAYTAQGTATLRTTGDVFDTVVKWSGAFGLGSGTYTVDLLDPATGLLIHKNTFQGKETLTNVHFLNGCVEYVDYKGEGKLGVNVVNIQPNPLPTVATPIFYIEGWQLNNLCTGIANMHYEGHYLNLFDLVLDVWGPPG